MEAERYPLSPRLSSPSDTKATVSSSSVSGHTHRRTSSIPPVRTAQAGYQIPPPIASSPYNMSSRLAPKNSGPEQILSALSRRGEYVENDLHRLVEAQGDGLMAGLGGDGPGGEPQSDGSNTPTATSSSNGYNSTKTVRSHKKKVGLAGARSGIAKRMDELALLQHQRSITIEEELERERSSKEKLDKFEKKSLGLAEETERVKQGGAGQQGKETLEEAGAVQVSHCLGAQREECC
jgi:hypothetical protein